MLAPFGVFPIVCIVGVFGSLLYLLCQQYAEYKTALQRFQSVHKKNEDLQYTHIPEDPDNEMFVENQECENEND